MLSFREVHIGDTAMACPPSNADPSFYRPGEVRWPPAGVGGAAGPSTGSPSTTPETASLFYLATCPSSLRVGQAVYVTGTNAVDVADCQRPDAVVGIATSKRSPTVVVVQTSGEVVLGLSGLSPGVDYFLGGNGELSPPPLDGVLFVQRVGVATTGTRLYLQLDGHVVRKNTP